MLQSGCSEPRQTLGGSGGQDCDPVVLRPLDKKPGGYSGFLPSTVSRPTQGEAFQQDSEEG